jgi:hypothetical protein
MSVTNSAYTTNSIKVTIANEYNSSNVINGVDSAMTTLGWTIWDYQANASTYNPITTRVYRVINADATTYKYCIVRWNTINLTFNISTCDSWDNVGHLPTNECWTNTGAFVQYYDLVQSFILVSATTRHCMFWPFVLNEPGMWSAILEFERIANEDTAAAGYPCYAYTNSLMIGTPFAQMNNTGIAGGLNGASQIMFAFSRTPDGQTGAYAAKVYAPITNRGMFPPNYPQGTISVSADSSGLFLQLASYYNITYGWNPLNSIVSPVSVDAQTKTMPFGRAFNVGVTKPLGSFLDSTTILGDNTGGWPNAAGSNTEYLLLPMNGGFEGTSAYGSSQQSTFAGNTAGAVIARSIGIGTLVWMASSDGIRTYDTTQGNGGLSVLRYAQSNGVYDIIYDGQRSVYGSTNTGVVKIDTANFYAVSLNTVLQGTAYLGLDNKYLYATQRIANVQPTLYMINTVSFSAGVNGVNIPGNVHVFAQFANVGGSGVRFSTAANPYQLAFPSGYGVPVPDYTGNVYVATQPGVGALLSQNLWIVQVNSESGNAIANVVNPTFPFPASSSAPNSANVYSSFIIDYNQMPSNRIFLVTSNAAGTPPTGTIWELQPNTMVTLASNTWVTTAFTANSTYTNMQANVYAGVANVSMDFRADLNVIPYRGMWYIMPKKVGQNLGNPPNSYASKVMFAHPQSPGAAGLIQWVSNSAITSIANNNPYGSAVTASTNGCRLYAPLYSNTSTGALQVITGTYGLLGINGTSTGRLLLKG